MPDPNLLARAFGSVRLRITVLAMVVFAIAAVVGSTVLVLSVRGSLELDPATRECCRGERGIDLTARQFSVLEVLMREAPNVVSKADILDEIWGSDVDRDPNVVEVYVSALRRKVDQPFGTRTIQTVPRLGYRMVGD